MYYTDDGLTTEATPTLLYWEEMYSFLGRERVIDNNFILYSVKSTALVL